MKKYVTLSILMSVSAYSMNMDTESFNIMPKNSDQIAIQLSNFQDPEEIIKLIGTAKKSSLELEAINKLNNILKNLEIKEATEQFQRDIDGYNPYSIEYLDFREDFNNKIESINNKYK